MKNGNERTRDNSLRSSVASLEESEKRLRKLFGLFEIDYSSQPIHRRMPKESYALRRELEAALAKHHSKMEQCAWILPEGRHDERSD